MSFLDINFMFILIKYINRKGINWGLNIYMFSYFVIEVFSLFLIELIFIVFVIKFIYDWWNVGMFCLIFMYRVFIFYKKSVLEI